MTAHQLTLLVVAPSMAASSVWDVNEAIGTNTAIVAFPTQRGGRAQVQQLAWDSWRAPAVSSAEGIILTSR
jgi:hypothetical protein